MAEEPGRRQFIRNLSAVDCNVGPIASGAVGIDIAGYQVFSRALLAQNKDGIGVWSAGCGNIDVVKLPAQSLRTKRVAHQFRSMLRQVDSSFRNCRYLLAQFTREAQMNDLAEGQSVILGPFFCVFIESCVSLKVQDRNQHIQDGIADGETHKIAVNAGPLLYLELLFTRCDKRGPRSVVLDYLPHLGKF